MDLIHIGGVAKDSIHYFVMDVDGTLTDGKIYMGPDGEVMKRFDVKDGYGIAHMLREADITPIIITGRESKIVRNRCDELGIDMVYQGVKDKLACLKEAVGGNAGLSQVLYAGDDLNDEECMRAVREAGGLTACPADAAYEIIKICDYVSRKPGGDGAIRDIIEWLLKER